MVMRAVHKFLGPVRRRIALMISRAMLSMADDTTLLQEVQVKLLGEETLSRLERFQQYGFTSVPHAGAEALALSLGGNRSHTVVVSVDDRRYRLKGLKSGEVALYDDRGQHIHLTRTGIDCTVLGDLTATVSGNALATVAGTATLDCPQTIVTGDLRVGGDLTVVGISSGDGVPMQISGGLTNTGGNVVSDGIVLDSHRHGGVTPGGGETGEPV
jgi:phage baseplate assembly protein V